MKREPGYYWVKMTERSTYEVALYFGGGKWELMGNRPASTHPTTIFYEIKETRIPHPDQKNSVQAIVKLDGKIISYLYDENIATAISSCVRMNLDRDNKITNMSTIETEIHSPPLKFWDIYPTHKKE